MKPSELATALRRIASGIDKSKSPDRNLVARDLKKVLAAVDPTGPIIIHFYGDGTYVDVRPGDPRINTTQDIVSIDMRNGETLIFAKSLNAIKQDQKLAKDNRVLEALFNRGIIHSDDDGNYIL